MSLMPLFKASKFKYFIDILKGYVFSFLSPFRIFNVHVAIKSKVSFFTLILGCAFWMAIFIPSAVHEFSFFDAEEGFKSNQGFHVLEYCSIENLISSAGRSNSFYSDIVSQIQSFTQESISKLGSGFVEFLSFEHFNRIFVRLTVKSFRVMECDRASQSSTENGPQNCCNCRVHNLVYPL